MTRQMEMSDASDKSCDPITIEPSLLERRYQVRRQGLSTGKTKLGKAIFHTVHRPEREFNVYQLRMREIEAIIRDRHGVIVPDPEGTDDRDTCLDYARAVAASLSSQDLHHWAMRWMPWATAVELEELARSVGWRKYMMGADQTARLLGVTLAERDRLNPKTIGACDVDTKERQAIARQAKRQRDRARKAEARRAAGRVDRQTYEASSVAAAKPWVEAGISRATWYRKHRETSVARVEIDNRIGDTPVSPVGDTPVPTDTDLATGRARRAPVQHDAPLRDGASIAGSGPHRTAELPQERAA